MYKPLDKRIRSVRLRCSINLLLRNAGRILIAAGIVAVLTVLIERLLAVTVITPATFWGFWAVAMALILAIWLVRQPSRMQASLLLDERLMLHERFSTTLALAQMEDPFAEAARKEAYERAGRADIRGHFPIKPSKCWIYAVSTWLTVVVLALFMPQKDLLGFLRKKEQHQEKTRQFEQAKVDVREAADPVKSSVKRLGEPELAEALDDLDKTLQDAEPEEIKRQAIRKLDDLAEKVRGMESDVQMQAAKMLRQTFKQLRGSSDPLSQKLRLAMAKGEFGRASELLKQLLRDIEQGNLDEQQQEALAKRLQELGRQIRKLAEQRGELEEELEKLGLDKKLARLDRDQLKQALQKQGLDAKKIELLMQKAAAMKMATSQCNGLGTAMAACGGRAGGTLTDGLVSVADQLDAFESLNQQLMLMEYSLVEISNAIESLGKGMCRGGKFGLCEGGMPADGIGTQPGDHFLANPLEQSATKKTRSASKVGKGPVIASWYFRGPQVKGEATLDFKEVVQAAREGASEAISENEIPRRYEDAIKQYFGGLERPETE